MAEKAKQHFVPKLLLKRFSWDATHINICNIRKSIKTQSVPYDPQCQKRYFYGADLHIENTFEKMENDADLELNKLINTSVIPNAKPNANQLDNSDVRELLLTFIYIQYSRTQKIKNIVNKEVNRLIKEDARNNKDVIFNSIKSNEKLGDYKLSDAEINNFIDDVEIELNEPFHHILRSARDEYNKNKHLKIVVLFNSTTVPFITSDNPAFCFTSFFPERTPSFFLPISPAHCLFCFDEHYFKARSIRNIVFISDQSEVRYINRLQCDNCDKNIYLPRLPINSSIQDFVDHNIKDLSFIDNIDAISLSERFENNRSIPLNGGHSSKADTFNA
ncbi:TPA: DUF4238 domain-containing protein [Serratia marcescens]